MLQDKFLEQRIGLERSTGSSGNEVWTKLCGLKIPNKIKVFGWRRAGQNILPTRVNLARLRIIVDDNCELCKMAPETGLRVLWECMSSSWS